MRGLGRALQIVGLTVLPVGMLLELNGALGRHFGLSDMVFMLCFGVIAFVLGRYVEGYARA